MVRFEAKLDLLHASPLMGRPLPLFIPVRRGDGTKRRLTSRRRLFLAWDGLLCQHEGPGDTDRRLPGVWLTSSAFLFITMALGLYVVVPIARRSINKYLLISKDAMSKAKLSPCHNRVT